ncbi:MAG TPA: hypothetical protein VHU80_23175 [Polyangiaceae bacterium]|jgi:hypothetical protein|nr:hypothetical protein [Polyangiaceae bacterium]
MSPRIVFENAYVTATLQPDASLVRYVRSAMAYPSIEQVQKEHREMLHAMAALEPETLGLLIDLRVAPPRNDEAFESEVTRVVNPLLSRFRAHAFLVRTAVGTLQVRRLSTSNGIPPNNVFSDEAAAMAYLAP